MLVQRDPAGITPVLETRIIEAGTITRQRQASEAGTAAQSALLELNQLRGQPVGRGAADVNVRESQRPRLSRNRNSPGEDYALRHQRHEMQHKQPPQTNHPGPPPPRERSVPKTNE